MSFGHDDPDVLNNIDNETSGDAKLNNPVPMRYGTRLFGYVTVGFMFLIIILIEMYREKDRMTFLIEQFNFPVLPFTLFILVTFMATAWTSCKHNHPWPFVFYEIFVLFWALSFLNTLSDRGTYILFSIIALLLSFLVVLKNGFGWSVLSSFLAILLFYFSVTVPLQRKDLVPE